MDTLPEPDTEWTVKNNTIIDRQCCKALRPMHMIEGCIPKMQIEEGSVKIMENIFLKFRASGGRCRTAVTGKLHHKRITGCVNKSLRSSRFGDVAKQAYIC